MESVYIIKDYEECGLLMKLSVSRNRMKHRLYVALHQLDVAKKFGPRKRLRVEYVDASFDRAFF